MKYFKAYFLPTWEFIRHYCNISNFNLDSQIPDIYFDRFMDDKNHSLLKQNLWLRERFYCDKNNRIYCDKSNQKLFNNNTNQQYNNPAEISFILKENNYDFNTVTAFIGYSFLRYYLPNNCTLDQVIFSENNLNDVLEILTIRFDSEQELKNISQVDLLPYNAKALASMQRYQSELFFQFIPDNSIPENQTLFPKSDLKKYFVSQNYENNDNDDEGEELDMDLMVFPDSE